MIAETLNTPYYAVIFTSILTDTTEGYGDMASRMEVLVNKQKGFLGFESAREEVGITVSYWESLEAIKKWKEEEEHSVARNKGRDLWYKSFKVRICKVEKDYGFGL